MAIPAGVLAVPKGDQSRREGGTVRTSQNHVERIALGMVLTLSLLMYFFPLVIVHGPDGDRLGDGPHVRDTLTELRFGLAMVASAASAQDHGSSGSYPKESLTLALPSDFPWSLKNAMVASYLILIALGCGVIALVDFVFLKKFSQQFSLAGCFCGVAAIILLMRMSSDLQSWTAKLVGSGYISSPNDPLPAARLLLANSFHVEAGPALYILTTGLFLVPFLSYTRATPRIHSIIRSEPRIQVTQPVRVRPLRPGYSEQDCMTVNVTSNGLLIESTSNRWYIGMEVFLTRNTPSGEPAGAEEHACVVRVERLEGQNPRFAVRLLKD